MKKLFTLFAAVLASVGLWAATETHPSSATSSEAVVGTCYTIPGTYVAGTGGKQSGEMQSKGVKFRLSNKVDKNNKGFYFKVNEGYKITDIAFCGHVNDESKTSTLSSVLVDGVNINFAPVQLPNRSSSVKFAVSGIAALDSIVFVFEGDGTQANLEYTITYEEAETKTVVSTEETITAITVNGDSLSAAQIAQINDWHESYEILYTQAYATAPTVVFSRHTVITYEDESTKVKDEDIEVVAEYINDEFTGEYWQAALVGTDKTFKVDMFVAASAVITYMDGETVLGRDTIAAGSKAVNYAKYEVKPLAAFGGWYNDAALTDPVDLSVQTFNADATVYGKFTKAYASSLNIEQLVLDMGTKADIKAILAAKGYAYENIDALDSLNDAKDNRNEPYLGLKLKTAGAYVSCNIKAGDTITVKFGNVGDDLKIGVNGEYRTLAKADAVLLGYKATADSYLEIITTSKNTVVLKQIMINENIADVVLPGEGGGEEKDTDATIQSLTINGVAVTAVENVYAYEVPADENLAQVEVVYTLNSAKASADPASGFKVDVPAAGAAANTQVITVTAENGNKAEYTVSVTRASSEAIDNTEATVKAVKVIRNGQLVIEKNGVRYNVLGTVME